MPGVPLLTPPASVTAPVAVPVITAASLAPLMVMVTTCEVPSIVKTVNVSVSFCPTLSACTAAVLLSKVHARPPAAVPAALGAEAAGGRSRRADRGPGVVRIVDVGRVQIASCSGDARRAVVDAASFGHRPATDAGNHRRIVGTSNT